MVIYLFVDRDVSENRMYSPGFRKHRAERQREPGHEEPRSRCAYVRKHIDAGHLTVQTQKYDAGVRQHGTDDYQIVQMRAGHFNVPETPSRAHVSLFKIELVCDFCACRA